MSVELVLSRLKGVKKNGESQWTALCPSHEDRQQSLSVGIGNDGKILFKCFAGCPFENIRKALRLPLETLFAQVPTTEPKHRVLVTVEAIAQHKHLPSQFLRQHGVEDIPFKGARITYRLMDGSKASRQRIRTSLVAKEGSRWSSGSGSSVPYGLWRLQEFASEKYLVLVEGETDVLTGWFHQLPVLGLPGADMAKKLNAEHIRAFEELCVIQEPDRGGEVFADGISSRVQNLEWHGILKLIKLSDAKDLSDLHLKYPNEFSSRFSAARDSAEALMLPIVSHEIGKSADSLPHIDAGDFELKRITPLAWEAVEQFNRPPTLFRSGGLPVRIEKDDKGYPRLRELVQDKMRHVLARSADWYRVYQGEVYPVLPPMHVVKDMLASPELPLPILTRIVEAPVFSPEGLLQTSSGYHPASQTYLFHSDPREIPEVAAVPSHDELQGARGLILDELIGEFPFTGEAERAHAFALLLLPFARDLINGATPLHLVEAPSPGTGKTLLINAVAFASLGRPVSTMSEGRDSDEWRKRLTSKLMERPDILLIDNIRRRLDSSALASAITSPCWEDRILGFSKVISLPVRCAWVANGNNPALSNEMSRRSIRIRMDAKADRPWLRDRFRHPDLMCWAREKRPQIIWAALTIIQGWIAQGRPPFKGVSLGMFESWSKTMGGVLSVAGVPGFLGNLNDFYGASDEEGNILRGFIQRWWEVHGDAEVGVAELFDLNEKLEEPINLGLGQEKSRRTKMGQELMKLRDRQFDEFRVLLAGSKQRAKQWKLISLSEPVNPVNLGQPDVVLNGPRETDIPNPEHVENGSPSSQPSLFEVQRGGQYGH